MILVEDAVLEEAALVLRRCCEGMAAMRASLPVVEVSTRQMALVESNLRALAAAEKKRTQNSETLSPESAVK